MRKREFVQNGDTEIILSIKLGNKLHKVEERIKKRGEVESKESGIIFSSLNCIFSFVRHHASLVIVQQTVSEFKVVSEWSFIQFYTLNMLCIIVRVPRDMLFLFLFFLD